MTSATPRLPFRQLFNGRLLFTVSILALSQFNFGFETTTFQNIQAMDDFVNTFGTMNKKGKKVLTPDWLSLFNGMSVIGFVCGIILGNQLSERIGRRKSVMFMCIWTMLCSIILLTSRTANQILAGRCLNQMYIGMELAIIPLYQAEITPLQARGAVVATYNTALITGGLVMSGITRATSDIKGRNSWFIPLTLFYIIPTIVLISAYFIPESPRWLMAKERDEEALKSLRFLRQGKFSEEQIVQEQAGIRAAVMAQGVDHVRESFVKKWPRIWNKKNIKRTGIVLGTNFFLHGTGNAFANTYGTLFLKSIGTVNPFSMSTGISAIALSSSILTLFLVDRIGRRPLLITGSVVQAIGLLIIGGLGTVKNPSYSIKSAIITFYVLFVAGCIAAWGQLSHTITAEIPSAEVRDVTYATGSVLAIGTSAINTFVLPYLLYEPYAALGPRVGFIFGALTVLSVLFSIFCVPECLGKSLEEIDLLFNSKVPIRKFQTTQVEIKVGEGDDENEKGAGKRVDVQIRDVSTGSSRNRV